MTRSPYGGRDILLHERAGRARRIGEMGYAPFWFDVLSLRFRFDLFPEPKKAFSKHAHSVFASSRFASARFAFEKLHPVR